MRVGAIPETLMERVALKLGLVPTPFLATLHAIGLGRLIMGATRLGVFEALAGGPLNARQVADRCAIHPTATQKSLNALVSAGYLKLKGDQYSLTRMSRKWLLKDSRHSLYDSMLFRYMEWDFIEHSEEFLLTGQPIRMHEEMTAEQWDLYQRGMRSMAGLSAPEVARRTPVPRNARDMLDIGGSHGYYSVSICRRHPGLSAVVMDLPDAVEHAAPLLARERMGDRVRHQVGNALEGDLGSSLYDVVFTANLVHHFDEEENLRLARRAARALRPGGYFVILDVFRADSPEDAGQVGALADLYFALTSEAGSWSAEEMAGWQRRAGLEPLKPIALTTMPGFGLQSALKPLPVSAPL